MKSKRAKRPISSLEYIVGEDDIEINMERDSERDSSSTESSDEVPPLPKRRNVGSDDTEWNDDRTSTHRSRDYSSGRRSKGTAAPKAGHGVSSCAACGRGPFRSMKLHLLHCSGVKVKSQCSLCKKLFVTPGALKDHYMPLYSCTICDQVFSLKSLYELHQCPKDDKPLWVFFCSEKMPQVCSICKCFFTTKEAVLSHINKVHASVVSTKICIITDPSGLTNKKVSPSIDRVVVQSTESNQNVFNQVRNGKLLTHQISAESIITTKIGSSTPPLLVPATSTEGPRTHTAPSTATPVSPSGPTIMAMFEHNSQEMASTEHKSTGCRAKIPRTCRQCGAVLWQPSFVIGHRYLHRGNRSHRCPCGRAFKHRLHLLRHCVQHAEATNYICVSCGETFVGARLFAKHMKSKSQKKSHRSGRSTCKGKVRDKCKQALTCDCGHLFLRPSAYIWHQLQNRTKTKH